MEVVDTMKGTANEEHRMIKGTEGVGEAEVEVRLKEEAEVGVEVSNIAMAVVWLKGEEEVGVEDEDTVMVVEEVQVDCGSQSKV